MRAISDRDLPEPFLSWINSATPLPSRFFLLPRHVDLTGDLLLFLIGGLSSAGMGTLIPALMQPWRFMHESWFGFGFVAAISLGFWSIPILLGKRGWGTFRALKSVQSGGLRQGILLGPEGMLVRMEPNRNYPIPFDRFIVATLLPGLDNPSLVIQTRDGSVEFFAKRLNATADQINDAAAELWRYWRKPAPLPRSRTKRKDDVTPRRLRTALLRFLTSATFVFLGFGIAAMDGAKPPVAAVATLIGFVGLAFAAMTLGQFFFRGIQRALAYRCPGCGRRTTEVTTAFPQIHYYCAACNVEWDTGMRYREGSGD